MLRSFAVQPSPDVTHQTRILRLEPMFMQSLSRLSIPQLGWQPNGLQRSFAGRSLLGTTRQMAERCSHTLDYKINPLGKPIPDGAHSLAIATRPLNSKRGRSSIRCALHSININGMSTASLKQPRRNTQSSVLRYFAVVWCRHLKVSARDRDQDVAPVLAAMLWDLTMVAHISKSGVNCKWVK